MDMTTPLASIGLPVAALCVSFWVMAAAAGCAATGGGGLGAKGGADWLDKPDIVVSSDGHGDFTTVGKALASLDPNGKNRVVIFIRDGVYNEHLAIHRSFVTLRGQSRQGARIEFALARGDWTKHPDDIGQAVVNVYGDDVVFQNLTIRNTQTQPTHAFALYGEGDRTVTLDCDLLSEGNDTVSLWTKQGLGTHYHARCHFRGRVDFLCPRGWTYVRDSSFYEVGKSAAVWHSIADDPNKKFVLRNCTFDGANDFPLGRYHRDHQFYFLDCTFSPHVTRDVVNVVPPDKEQLKWGHRVYFYNCHRQGGDAPWHADNLDKAPGHPTPQQITVTWAYDGAWNPERTDAPKIVKVARGEDGSRAVLRVTFSEPVTVRGKPELVGTGPGSGQKVKLPYLSGNGSDTLTFGPPPADLAADQAHWTFDTWVGTIFASGAGATLRPVK
jgi:pectinesterase